jgi:hypothetical protein
MLVEAGINHSKPPKINLSLMRSFTVTFFRLVVLATLASSASAQLAWDLVGGNGNSPVEFTVRSNSTYRISQGGTTPLTTVDFLKTGNPITILAANQNSGILFYAPPEILYLDVIFQDGGNAAAQTVTSSGGGNLFFSLYRNQTPAFDDSQFFLELNMPESIGGSFFSGVTYAGGTDVAFFNAFDFTFDGSGKVTITTNGSYTFPDAAFTEPYFAVNFTAVPEPASAVLLFSLLAAGVAVCRRRPRR